MIYKKIFFFFYFVCIIALLFFLGDFIISKNSNLFHIKKDCFNYKKINHKGGNFYSYNLKKNCFAFEHKGSTPSYKVFTDKNGFRTSNEKRSFEKNSKIIFLGDSFAYGFGVNYDESIPGLISKKISYKEEVINFGVPGYSPSVNYSNLKLYLNKYSNIEISKVFYILDLTDVHDESNRWNDITGLDFPIIVDKTTRKEIKKTFSYENKFRVSRFVAYHLNNYLRNFKKKIKKLYEDKEEIDIDLKGTYWGSFTHTDQNKLFKDPVYKKMWGNDYQVGLKKIKVKIKDISSLLKSRNIDFYITIHPWRETLELGQKKFNWENYANELCDISDCTKVINLFDTIRDVKKNNSNWKNLLYFKHDLHFNETGNSVYAEKIYNEALINN